MCLFVVYPCFKRFFCFLTGPAIKDIFSQLPDRSVRQTLLFSATWPKAVRALAATFLKTGPDEVKELFMGDKDAELEANKAVSQTFIQATDDEKDKKLFDFLSALVSHFVGSCMILVAI